MDMRLIKVQVTQEDALQRQDPNEVRRINSNQEQSNFLNINEGSEKSPGATREPKEANDFKLFTESVTRLEVNREEEKKAESSERWDNNSEREHIRYESLQDRQNT